ncbi:MAG: DUF4416 family protein [Candidatus Woesearchaeota archaeon]
MAKVKEISKAKLFVGVLYNDEEMLNKVVKELIQKYGEIEQESKTYEFNFTNYYENEMGKNLIKKFIVFKNLINRDEIADIKIETNKIEDKYSKNNNRLINLDPGYLTKDNIILASVKESPYKVYIGNGIFSHLTLIYGNKKWNANERTFPDFKTNEVQEFFLEVRKCLI